MIAETVPRDQATGACRTADELGLYFRSDPEAVEHGHEMNAARAFLGMSHGFCVKQRALERLDGTDVGLAGARAHGDAHAAAGDVGARRGHDLSRFDQIVDHLRQRDRDIERRAGVDLPLHHRPRYEGDGEPVPGRPLELRSELTHHRADPAGADDLDLGRLCCDPVRQQRREGEGGCGNCVDSHGLYLPSTAASYRYLWPMCL
jgi:hypothetical protein